MQWVSRLADQKDEEARRREIVENGANRIFGELIVRVKDALATYNQRVHRPQDEKAYLDGQSVRFGTENPAGVYTPTPNGPSIGLSLHSPSTITAIYSTGRAPEIFTLDLDDRDYLRLRYDNGVISIDQVTEIILASFLFGDPVGS